MWFYYATWCHTHLQHEALTTWTTFLKKIISKGNEIIQLSSNVRPNCKRVKFKTFRKMVIYAFMRYLSKKDENVISFTTLGQRLSNIISDFYLGGVCNSKITVLL